MKDKELEKLEKYQLLKGEIAKVWHMRKVVVCLLLLGPLEPYQTNRRECEVGRDPENSFAGNSKDTKESTIPARRRKRETWDP